MSKCLVSVIGKSVIIIFTEVVRECEIIIRKWEDKNEEVNLSYKFYDSNSFSLDASKFKGKYGLTLLADNQVYTKVISII